VTAPYARVVVDVTQRHLDQLFDYAVPQGRSVAVGHRVRVPFAGRRRTGWVAELADEPTTDPARVKPLARVDGPVRWFDTAELDALRWVAGRWAGTLGGVLRLALPPRVAGLDDELAALGPAAPPQPADRPPCPASAWRPYPASRLLQAAAGRQTPQAAWWRPLPGDDVEAMLADLVNRCVAAGRSALVLAPDPASPLLDLALGVAGPMGADLRPGDDRRRYRAFARLRAGHARVAVGERGAALTPVPNLGLVVLADEASPAWKERRSPRFHARDAVLGLAALRGASAVVTGTLPSGALWRLARAEHVRTIAAPRERERAAAPLVTVVDPSTQPASRRGRLTAPADRALREAVAAGRAGLVVAARRGDGTRLACRRCRARRACPVCDGALGDATGAAGAADAAGDTGAADATGAAAATWACATCGWRGEAFACSLCEAEDVAPLAAGAGRLATELARAHPGAHVARMEGFDAPGPRERPAIGVCTRGSIVARPDWLAGEAAAVTVLPDADAWLARPRLDAAEDALRLWLAIARWSERIVLQTREPTHPAVQALVRADPEGFWRAEEPRRAELRLPPATSVVLVRAPAEHAGDVAAAVRAAVPAEVSVLGPDPDGATLVKTDDLRGTLRAIEPLQRTWDRDGPRVRLDVDAIDAV